MGVDIYANRGIVVPESEMLGLITEENVPRVRSAIIGCVESLCETLTDLRKRADLEEWELDSRRTQALFFAERLSQLDDNSDAEQVREMLESLTAAVEDGFNSHVENGEHSVVLWTAILDTVFPALPHPESTVLIDSPRYQGHDLPVGEILYVFPENDCVAYAKTKKGAALDAAMGRSLPVSTWTIYSV